MNSLTHTLRTTSLTAVAALALLTVTGPAALASSGADAQIDVAHGCSSIDVSSTKDISNVVLQFVDGDRQRFEDLPESRTGTFAGTGQNSGEFISVAWIKSGANFSGDGSGYGERFDFDAGQCQTVAATSQGAEDDPGTNDAGNDESDRGPKGAAKDKPVTTRTDNDKGDTSSESGDKDDDIAAANLSDVDADDDGDTDEDRSTGIASTDDDSGSTDGSPTGSAGTDVASSNDVLGSSESAVNGASNAAATDETRAAQVLGVSLDRVRAADAGAIRFADMLPNTGAPVGIAVLAALSALGIGGGLLRRSRTS